MDTFRYLGVIVSSRATDYIPLNLDPVILEIKAKLKSWGNLPLSLWGRVNLFKMKVIPKLTYLFRHSPQWVPKSFFKKLNHIFSSFLWGALPPRYKLSTLMRPRTQGGMAFPDCYKYYLATQLVTAAWWLDPDGTNSSTVLGVVVEGSLEALKLLVYRGPRAPYPLTPSMHTTLQALGAGLSVEKYKQNEISPNAPIWLSPNIPHLYKMLDPDAWTKYSVKLISHIVSQNALVPFSQVSSMNNIPNHYLFCYLQLSHAFAAQFPQSSCMVVQSGWRRHSDPDVLKSLPHIYMSTWCLCLSHPWISSGPVGNETSLHWTTMTVTMSGISPLAPWSHCETDLYSLK